VAECAVERATDKVAAFQVVHVYPDRASVPTELRQLGNRLRASIIQLVGAALVEQNDEWNQSVQFVRPAAERDQHPKRRMPEAAGRAAAR
jgi:hypothetical protein